MNSRIFLITSFAGLLALAQHETEKPFPGNTRVKLQLGAVRLRITNAAGEYFAPLGHLSQPDGGKRMSGDLIMGTAGEQLHAYVHDGAEIDLPHGDYTFETRRGLEFIPLRQKVAVAGERQTVSIAMKRLADFESQGWYPGDTHMHFPDPAGVRNEMECEGLRVCSLLLLKSGYPKGRPGDGHFQNVEHFSGKLHPVSDAKYFVKVGEEFRHGLLAHLIFQDLKRIKELYSHINPRANWVEIVQLMAKDVIKKRDLVTQPVTQSFAETDVASEGPAAKQAPS